jgi:hypothetical protein
MFVVYRMSYYLIAFLFGHVLSNAARLSQTSGNPIFELVLLQGLISPARGMLNFCAFMFSFVTSPARELSQESSVETTSTIPDSYDDGWQNSKI